MHATLFRSLILVFLLQAGCSSSPVSESPTPPSAADAELLVPIPLATRRPLPPPDTVWSELSRGFQLPRDPERVEVSRALTWLAAQPDLLTSIQPRAERYLAYLVQQVQKRGLPLELALLPIVESTLDPYAFSSSGAAGLWQLIPGTANHYGVAMSWWYDGRRDPVDSTRAALDYLEYLYARFDDWLLAVAAYNAGEGRIGRALRRASKGGSRDSFWDLPLPEETTRYVPRMLALAELIAESHAAGETLPPLSTQPGFEVHAVAHQIDVTLLARLAEVPVEEIFQFNPGLNRGATPPDGPHRILLPEIHAASLRRGLANYPHDGSRWDTYVVRDGDSLSRIAETHATSVAAIRASNTLSSSLIRSGDRLMIPRARVSARRVPENPLLRRGGGRYKVAAGDSLWSISRRYSTSVASLVRGNRLDPRRPLQIGQTLIIPGGSADRKIHYRVRKGDSLALIARKHHVRITDIARWNGIDVQDYLQPGQRLVLFVPMTGSYS